MKQNNIFNRFFFKEVLKEEKEKYERCKSLVGHFPELDERIGASKSLEEVLELHKKAWGLGYQNGNLAPCEYGMFRTKNISKMTPNEVYLGNIYGLWTHSLPKWEETRNEKFSENITIYDVILSQYKNILRSNIRELYKEAKNIIISYEKVNPPKDLYKKF